MFKYIQVLWPASRGSATVPHPPSVQDVTMHVLATSTAMPQVVRTEMDTNPHLEPTEPSLGNRTVWSVEASVRFWKVSQLSFFRFFLSLYLYLYLYLSLSLPNINICIYIYTYLYIYMYTLTLNIYIYKWLVFAICIHAICICLHSKCMYIYIYRYFYLSIYLSFYLSIYLSICVYLLSSFYVFIHLFIDLSESDSCEYTYAVPLHEHHKNT